MGRILHQQVSFADIEFQHLRQLNPVLQAVSDLLDRESELVEMVSRDLRRGLKKPNSGRDGLSPSQALRSLVVMRIKNWDYRELRERIDDGLCLRSFTHFDSHAVPKHDAFNRAFVRITPQTMREINQKVILGAVNMGLEDGQMLRVDTTVTETNIHYPTDSTLLWDSVRTITRLVRQMNKILPLGVRGSPNRTRSARRRMQEIERMSAQQRVRQQERKYRELLRITGEVVEGARDAVTQAERAQARKRAPVLDVFESAKIDGLKKEIAQYCSLADRVMDQTRRRVIDGEQVPAEEKVYSIFEPHTDMIKRGKERKPVEFGHKVRLAESAQGLITDYKVLDGNPSDTNQVADTLQRHEEIFSHVPKVFAGDRGFFSAENEANAQDRGVAEVCIPQRGGVKTPERTERERSAAFKEGQRFRVGIEGRISVLFRGRGMKRCLAKGRERFEVLVGAAVLANNLLRIAALQKEQEKKRRKAAA